MNDKVDKNSLNFLYSGILNLKSIDECQKFFDDICTIQELKAIAQRFEVAHMLDKGLTYIEIAEKTGASTATISRVNKAFNYGEDGYKIVLNRNKENEEKS